MGAAEDQPLPWTNSDLPRNRGWPGCKPVVVDDKGQAEKPADGRGSGDPASGGSGGEWTEFILSGSAI